MRLTADTAVSKNQKLSTAPGTINRRLRCVLMASGSVLVMAQFTGGIARAAADGCSVDSSLPAIAAYNCTGTIVDGLVANGTPNVTVNSDATFNTAAAFSRALVAQTNTAGNVDVISSGVITTTGNFSSGLSALNYSDGNTTLLNSGTIKTSGSFSNGITASSINGATSVTSFGVIKTTGEYSTGLTAANTNGSNTTVTSGGSIATSGRFSGGIAAEGGNVAITVNGSVATTGDFSTAVSAYASSGNTISVAVGGTLITTGLYSSAINARSNGGDTTISILKGGSVSALSGPAINGDGYRGWQGNSTTGNNFTINNAGTISGDVIIRANNVVFNNLAGGVFNMGQTVDINNYGWWRLSVLGAPSSTPNGTLVSSGIVTPGTTGTGYSTLYGNYVQTPTGALKVGTDFATGRGDQLSVTGTAQLAGTVLINPLNLNSNNGRTQQFRVLTADGGITDNGVKAQSNLGAVQYSLLSPDANTLNVKATIDFQGTAAARTTFNQSAVGQLLNTYYDANQQTINQQATLTRSFASA